MREFHPTIEINYFRMKTKLISLSIVCSLPVFPPFPAIEARKQADTAGYWIHDKLKNTLAQVGPFVKLGDGISSEVAHSNNREELSVMFSKMTERLE